jgi:hypothetical protein
MWHNFNTKMVVRSSLVSIDFGAEKGKRVSEGRARDQGRQGGKSTGGPGGKAELYGGLGYVEAIGGGLLPWARQTDRQGAAMVEGGDSNDGEQVLAAESGDHEKASTNAHCQAGSTRDSVVSSDEFCGGEGTTGISGDAIPKGRWLQALLSPATHYVEVACLSSKGQVKGCEEAISAKGVSAFNAKVELCNCRG